MAKIILEGHIVVPEDRLGEVALPLHIKLTRQEQGCLVFRVKQDKAQSNVFHVYEESVDKLSFQCHQQRVKESKWGEVTASVSRHYKTRELVQ